MRRVVEVASLAKKPSDSDVAAFFKGLVDVMQKAGDLKFAKKSSEWVNHLSTVADGIKCLGWPGYPNTPVSYIKEMLASADFYANKVLVNYRKIDQKHGDFVTQFKTLVEKLGEYVKEYHTTGLKWNPKGKDLKEALNSAGAAPAASTPAPSSGSDVPPPPGPPPPPPVTVSSGSGDADTRGALFAALNKGEAVTSGLKKVTDDMKTKNRADRTAVVTIKEKETKLASGKKEDVLGEPLTELQGGKKWVVQYHKKNRGITIEETDMKQVVYIYKCVDSAIQIKGKVNAITVDGCIKTAIVFENAVSSIELINCKSMQVQVVGKVPTVSIDKTDGANVYLSKDSLDTKIVTSKSSEMNINIPKGEDDYVELPLPEQYVTTYNVDTGKIKTEINESV